MNSIPYIVAAGVLALALGSRGGVEDDAGWTRVGGAVRAGACLAANSAGLMPTWAPVA